MDVRSAIAHISKQITTLEKQIYDAETVILPRLEQDKKILLAMRGQMVKLENIKVKIENREEISAEELAEAVPAPFR